MIAIPCRRFPAPLRGAIIGGAYPGRRRRSRRQALG